MGNLIIRQRDLDASVIPLDRLRMTIGRSSRNDICLGDPFASRLHAEIRREGDQVMFVDMGSANGSFLNGQRVSGTLRLDSGDRVRIGETEIEYQSDNKSPLSGPTVFLSGGESDVLPANTITTTSLGGRTTDDLISRIRSGSMTGATLSQKQ